MNLRDQILIVGFLVLFSTVFSSCKPEERQDYCFINCPQASPDNVLKNLQTAYLTKDIRQYSRLLADDFRFHVDTGTRQQLGLPEYWLHDEDSLRTRMLFESPKVSDIRIKLTYGSPRPSTEVGGEDQVYIDVLDTFLEVDLAPSPSRPEGVTLRVDGQLQRFFFRKGRTPADPDSLNWYITEWRDYGFGATAPDLAGENTTWSRIKSFSK